MLNDSDYILAHRHETFDHGKPMGVKIYIATGRKPTTQEENLAWKLGDQMFNEIWHTNTLQNPESIANAAKDKEDILKLFEGKSIYVEEIPNGYCSQPCCCNKPWFIITTPIGHIQIGWRKRVINIDWTRTLQKKIGIDLFPKEDVTKGEHYIHAWGYEKAKEYLDIIHNVETP
jgi:hypothetical protein